MDICGHFMDLDDRDRYLTEDGTVDTAAVTAGLAVVVVQRPHLARVDGPRRPAPGPSQGQRNGPSGAAEQIRGAETRGDWAAAISLKKQQLATQGATSADPQHPFLINVNVNLGAAYM